jgi:FixJ family two-component response regulator
LLKEFGFAVQAFSSAEEFLASDYLGQTECVILDIAMPGMSGPDLLRELRLRGQKIPIVFITAYGDEASDHACSNTVPWSACSSLSAMGLCVRR